MLKQFYVYKNEYDIPFYTIKYTNGHVSVDSTWYFMKMCLNKPEKYFRSLFKKYNPSNTNLPYFMEQINAQKVADQLNGLYVANEIIKKGG